jgi:hypothetical protein
MSWKQVIWTKRILLALLSFVAALLLAYAVLRLMGWELSLSGYVMHPVKLAPVVRGDCDFLLGFQERLDESMNGMRPGSS